ncbi:MAG: nucleoside triphosphate pyrophosphohydrolase [Acidobacteria bacterium]|nr:nucleoside triphosphate pyrophosphohydrolase [Acidobacteriota bacterium]
MPATFTDLVALMSTLRSPEGCPWDREQTYATLAPMLLEEAYEAVEAVEEAREGRPAELRDELGDLLFQIIFYAQVASERGEFTIEDVVDQIHTKMVRRHPHVFAGERAADTADVLRNWEAIKAAEKRAAGKDARADDASLLDGVSAKAPALMEAHQLTTKAARVGFDWQRVEDIFDKLREETDELRAAIRERDEAQRSRANDGQAKTDGQPESDATSEQLRREAPSRPASEEDAEHARVREEVGDLLFAVTNLARHLGVEPEAALKLTNRKFRRRFRHIERGLASRARALGEASLEEMEELWQEAKGSDG